ncbi:MAG: tRNA uridine-5-carboxymethylaminomethyl(34) synthesis GTPase MnmE [Candidatus Omnitrophota bacterium]|nr:tRNA uridine-5-carboxymethylaminomethyl(34) synthesis GTPase MnmE [Candidatus Omnitrophota bacterium]
MRLVSLNDTIAAISTPIGESGIGIVRLSGKAALMVADKIFTSKGNKGPSTFKSHAVKYGWIIKATSQEVIDEVLLTVMRAPRSYTREDTVEISCHGGIIALRAVLDLVLVNGCRLAEPGEFTRRAFLNGRIDLAQAEAVLDIIKAKTDSALEVGERQLKGVLSAAINKIRNNILDILSLVEANIDFPEEGLEHADLKKAYQKLRLVDDSLSGIIKDSYQGRILREGIQVVICGKPNVGKSSLLNALLKQERSIVTSVAGTTRDTIEEIIDIKGIPIRIVDTAGIIEPKDLISKKAIQRTKNYIRSADLVILVFDGSKRLSPEDFLLMQRMPKKPVIPVINKVDLKNIIEKDLVLKNLSSPIELSAKKLRNLKDLEQRIVDLVYKGKVTGSESILISNLRHVQLLTQAEKLIAQAGNSLDNKLSLEFIAQDIKDALGFLDDILGKRFSEDLLDKIFSDFCIGK